MNKLSTLLLGAAAGAGALYFYDPQLGRRRRKLFMDQMNHLCSESCHGAEVAYRDLKNRAQGTVAETKSMFSSGAASDRVIHDRIRSTLGRHVSHPRAIHADVERGNVCLTGTILRDEIDGLVSALKRVKGVQSIHTDFDAHFVAGNVSSLQGEGRSQRCQSTWTQPNWAPATRLVAGSIGAVMMANCATRWTPMSMLLGTLGCGLFTRAVANQDVQTLMGSASGEPIRIEKTTEINASAHQIFEFFSNPRSYQRITGQFVKIEDLGAGRFAKEMMVGGMPFRFEERVTRSEPGMLLQTASLSSSMLQYTKSMWFEETADDVTRVHVQFDYHPPGGKLGHAAAAMAGFDPKTLLDDLMMRAKQFLETGKSPHDALVRDESPMVGGSVGAMAAEERFNPDVLDRFSDAARDRSSPVGFDEIPRDTRDLLGDSQAAQTDEDGQNFIESIQTAVTESPTQDEVNEANKPGNTLETDRVGASGTPKPLP